MAISVSDLVSPNGAQDITAVETAAPAPTSGAEPPPPGFLQEPMTPKDESKAQIPDAVLQLPTFRPLLQGKPPALSITQEEFDQDPEAQTIQANVEPLVFSGFGLYRTKDGKSAVLYNGQYIDGAAIKLADERGQLGQVATPYSELKTFFADNLGEAAVEPTAPAPASQPMGAPAPASTQTKLANARIKNLAVGSATSGPVPGGGRVLNNILKPTV